MRLFINIKLYLSFQFAGFILVIPPPLFSRYPGTICQNKLYPLYSPGILGLYARINYILCILQVSWDYMLD